MSNQLPSREQAIKLLKKNHCAPKVILHCQAVADLSLEIAEELKKKGCRVNLKLIEVGGLLHDIGRSKTNAVDHGVVGSQIAKSEDLPEGVVNIIKRHVGGGITSQEAASFGWPPDVYMPITLEEKIVSYADKLIDNHKETRVPIEVEIERLQARGFNDAAQRVRKIHEEITGLLCN